MQNLIFSSLLSSDLLGEQVLFDLRKVQVEIQKVVYSCTCFYARLSAVSHDQDFYLLTFEAPSSR